MKLLEVEARATGYAVWGLSTSQVAGLLTLLVLLLSWLVLLLDSTAASPEVFTPERFARSGGTC